MEFRMGKFIVELFSVLRCLVISGDVPTLIQVNFDLFTKLFLVVGVCSMFQTLALLDIRALEYIGKIFVLLQGPLIFVVAMCRTRVAFLFKRYFCQVWYGMAWLMFKLFLPPGLLPAALLPGGQ